MANEKHTAEEPPQRGQHHFGWRNDKKNYYWRGTYHVTITVKERRWQPFGRIEGDVSMPDGDPQAPHVVLNAIGKMVEQELTTSISKHYSMLEVQDYVIMPDHLHFIVVAHKDIISSNGRPTHLGQVIAGFKKGCNRRYWEITGQTEAGGLGKPAQAGTPAATASAATAAQAGTSAATATAAGPQAGTSATTATAAGPQAGTSAATATAAKKESQLPAVYPQGYKVPSKGSSERPPLFASGYVDVMPLQPGQLEQQRQYIHNNPRYRLLRMQNRSALSAQRHAIDTLVTPAALHGFLVRERALPTNDAEAWQALQSRLLIDGPHISCDTYGASELLRHRLLPVVCHRDDIRKGLLSKQKEQCLAAAANGAILVSPRIAPGEQDIMDEAIRLSHPVILIVDNGFSEIYHPSEQRQQLCAMGGMLLVSPWSYRYRPNGEDISVAECKTMNCVAQAICKTKDDWWKNL